MSRRREDPVTGGKDDRSNSSSNPPLDGAFLLQLLRRPPQVQPTAPPPLSAAAAAGPNQSFAPHNFFRPPPPPEPYTGPLQFSPPTLPEFHRTPWAPPGFAPSDRPNSQIPVSRQFIGGDPVASSPSPASDIRRNSGYHSDRSFPGSRNLGSQGMGERSIPNPRPGYRNLDNGFATRRDFDVGSAGPSRGFKERNHSYSSGAPRQETHPRPGMNDLRRPPGTQMQSKGPGEWVASKGKANSTHGTEKVENHESKVHYQYSPSSREGDSLWRERSSSSYGNGGEVHTTRSLFSHRLDRSEDASVSTLHTVEGSDNEQGRNHSQPEFKRTLLEVLEQIKDGRVNEFADQLMDSLLHKDGSLIHMDASLDKKVTRHSDARRGKDLRSDSLRGNQMLSQRMRIRRRETRCRHDIESLAPHLLSIYESLVPAAEEKAKQKQLLMSLVKLVTKEWPNAQLHVYGSCANSFGFSNSDIDICLEIDDSDMSKSEILLKLADILQSDNLENVQALIHARVPIVKMMDPITGISCDICVNNLLAVVNTKLLRDYARIDERLRQLAFIVKHWAKSRRVNETYRGTLSSYAYVLMCIHFLQLRKPAILPCLQEMVATYTAVVEGAECAYFDQVEKLHNFGAGNSENIARLLWAFFHYWAYYHDYTNDVISVRTGRIISKQAKEWTRRIGIDRHLVCIEDPFETAHDLGRVVDKFSIKILREEFERAAYILQYDPNPSVALFEPYVLEQH